MMDRAAVGRDVADGIDVVVRAEPLARIDSDAVLFLERIVAREAHLLKHPREQDDVGIGINAAVRVFVRRGFVMRHIVVQERTAFFGAHDACADEIFFLESDKKTVMQNRTGSRWRSG